MKVTSTLPVTPDLAKSTQTKSSEATSKSQKPIKKGEEVEEGKNDAFDVALSQAVSPKAEALSAIPEKFEALNDEAARSSVISAVNSSQSNGAKDAVEEKPLSPRKVMDIANSSQGAHKLYSQLDSMGALSAVDPEDVDSIFMKDELATEIRKFSEKLKEEANLKPEQRVIAEVDGKQLKGSTPIQAGVEIPDGNPAEKVRQIEIPPAQLLTIDSSGASSIKDKSIVSIADLEKLITESAEAESVPVSTQGINRANLVDKSATGSNALAQYSLGSEIKQTDESGGVVSGTAGSALTTIPGEYSAEAFMRTKGSLKPSDRMTIASKAKIVKPDALERLGISNDLLVGRQLKASPFPDYITIKDSNYSDPRSNVVQLAEYGIQQKSNLPSIEMKSQVTKGAMAKNRFSTEALKDMSSNILKLNSVGGGEMKIRLSPDSLGELNLKVSTHGNQVRLHIQASSEESKQILQESLVHLKSNLESKNLSLSSVEVGLAHHANNAVGIAPDRGQEQFLNQNSFADEAAYDQWNSSQGDSRSSREGYLAGDEIRPQAKAYSKNVVSPNALNGHSVLNMDGRLNLVV